MANTISQWAQRLYEYVVGNVAVPFAQTGPTQRISTPELGNDIPKPAKAEIQPLRKPRRNRPEDPIDAFFDMLVEAVDRDGARVSLTERLQDAETEISKNKKDIDETNLRIECLEATLTTAPELADALAIALQEHQDNLNRFRVNVEEHTEAHELLKRRLGQSRRELTKLLTTIYAATDSVLGSLAGLGRINATIPGAIECLAALRTAATFSRRIAVGKKRVTQLQKDYNKAVDHVKAAQSPGQGGRRKRRKAEAYKRLEQAESAYKMECKHQEEREACLLKDIAPPFLIRAQYTCAPPISAQESNDADLQEFSREHRPKEDWSGEDGILAAVDDGIRPNTTQARIWKNGRKAKHSTQNSVSRLGRNMSMGLARHLYCYPNSTKRDHETFAATQLHGANYEELLQKRREKLEKVIPIYDNYRSKIKTAGIQDLPLSASWAASQSDGRPSQASSTKPLTQDAFIERSKYTRHWVRQVARNTPLSDSGDVVHVRQDELPAAFHALRSPTMNSGMIGIISPTLSLQSRRRRIDRVEEIRAFLREQLDKDGGPLYRPDASLV